MQALRGWVEIRNADSVIMSRPTHQQEDAQKRDSLRDDSECELEHDVDRLGDASLHSPGQRVLVFGYGVEVVCGSVPQPEFLRAADEGVSQFGVEPMIWELGMQFCAIQPPATVAKGERVSEHEPTERDEGGYCDCLQTG